ncbi:MAG TPA: MFS transporter [Jatrophihabitans sp.]|nr:MFS transporter [Jatrophihabitans sp.]
MAGSDVRLAYRIIAFHTLASFGWGLVFPFTAIYLASRHGIGTGAAALYYAGAGTANLAVAILLSLASRRPSDYPLAALGTSLSVVGYLVLSLARNDGTVLLAALTNGTGQGCLLAAIVPIMNSLVPEERRREIFARRYQALNVALALGAVTAGATASVVGRRMLPLLFVGQAVAYLPLVLVLLARAVTGRRARPPAPPVAAGQRRAGVVPLRGLIGMVGAAALFQLGAYLFGYSQFEATAPLVADRLLSTGLFVVSLMLAVNVAVIFAVQGRITRWLSRWDEAHGLRIALAFWIAGFAVAAATAPAPRAVQLAGLIGYAVLFGVGECAYSCSFHPWLITLSPEGELTRASALVNSMMGIGMFVGPSFGVGLVSLGHAPLVWLALAGCLGLVLLTVSGRERLRWLGRRPVPVTVAGADGRS